YLLRCAPSGGPRQPLRFPFAERLPVERIVRRTCHREQLSDSRGADPEHVGDLHLTVPRGGADEHESMTAREPSIAREQLDRFETRLRVRTWVGNDLCERPF